MPLIIAHRALTPGGIENSRGGIARAALAGADIVELDVRLSVDGTPFLLHDALLGRTTLAHGPIRLTPASLLRAVSLRGGDGERLSTLKAVLAELPDSLEAGLHVKNPRELNGALRAVSEAGVAERTWFWLGETAAVAHVRAMLPSARVTLLDPSAHTTEARLAYIERAANAGARAISLPWSTLTSSLIGPAHQRGLLVFSLLQPRHDLRSGLDAGVDGIITADPAQTSEAVATWRTAQRLEMTQANPGDRESI